MKGNALLHYLKYKFGIEKATTQTSYIEQEALKRYTNCAKVIVEIGVFEGFNTREFALHSPNDAIIYAIDPFFKGFLGFSYGKKIAIAEWRRNEVAKKIKLLEGLSWEVHNQLPKEIDLVFIDGDHSFEGVAKDFKIYANLLSTNGVIALHDARCFHNGWTKESWGPVRLMQEVVRPSGKWDILEEIDSLVILRRK